MWVIKLGGSLLGQPELPQWLNALTRFGDGKIVIVPGGGLFADAVREAQAETLIADGLAHEMAVMAMDQYAMLMTGLNPDLVMAASELEIAESGWQHRAIVWKPSSMVLADTHLPRNWDLTSDSLAAWLATKLNAEHLLIVKSIAQITEKNLYVEDLMESGVVDRYFGHYACHQSFRTWLLTKSEFIKINRLISHQSAPSMGVEIVSRGK